MRIAPWKGACECALPWFYNAAVGGKDERGKITEKAY